MTELSTDYLEGVLPWGVRLAARWHLLICSMCRAYYDQLARTRRLLRGLALPSMPPDAETALVDAGGASAASFPGRKPGPTP